MATLLKLFITQTMHFKKIILNNCLNQRGNCRNMLNKIILDSIIYDILYRLWSGFPLYSVCVSVGVLAILKNMT